MSTDGGKKESKFGVQYQIKYCCFLSTPKPSLIIKPIT